MSISQAIYSEIVKYVLQNIRCYHKLNYPFLLDLENFSFSDYDFSIYYYKGIQFTFAQHVTFPLLQEIGTYHGPIPSPSIVN